jgi:hypothetical protein
MSKLEEIFSIEREAPKDDTVGVAMYGSFICQVCNENVGEATLLIEKNILVYECSKGHRSKAKM